MGLLRWGVGGERDRLFRVNKKSSNVLVSTDRRVYKNETWSSDMFGKAMHQSTEVWTAPTRFYPPSLQSIWRGRRLAQIATYSSASNRCLESPTYYVSVVTVRLLFIKVFKCKRRRYPYSNVHFRRQGENRELANAMGQQRQTRTRKAEE